MKGEDCYGNIVPAVCRKCGSCFDLEEDLKQSKGNVKKVLEEDCGASEMLCWKCRDCK